MLGLCPGENPKMIKWYIGDVLICGFCMKPVCHAEQQQNFKPQALPAYLILLLWSQNSADVSCITHIIG